MPNLIFTFHFFYFPFVSSYFLFPFFFSAFIFVPRNNFLHLKVRSCFSNSNEIKEKHPHITPNPHHMKYHKRVIL